MKALVLALAASPALAADVTGIPIIVDGDTVEIGGTKIRLEGIDAPETDQICFRADGTRDTCGLTVRNALITRYGGKVWICQGEKQDRYRRTLARCSVDGEDVQKWLVRNGLALSFVRYSHAYDADEAVARKAKAGIWAGCFVAPWDTRGRNAKSPTLGAACDEHFREALLRSEPDEAAPSPECGIKAITNRRECIYHLPGGRFYTQVKISSGKGRRWFCSRDEAEAAGCRPAR